MILTRQRILCVLFFCVFAIVSAQRYQIRETRYEIEGRTQEYSLQKKLDIDYDRIWESEQELQSYIESLKTELASIRVFKESSVSYTLSDEADANGITGVYLDINTSDTINMIGLIYPKYDSNNGFQLKLRFKDGNFAGSMDPMDAEAYYQYNEKAEHVIAGTLNFVLPFPVGIFHAEWLNEHDFEYNISTQTPEFDFSSGLLFSYDFKRVSLELIFKQGFLRNIDYAPFSDAMFGNEYAEFAAPVKAASIDGWGDIIWRPKLSLDYSWDADGIQSDNLELYGLRLIAGHSLKTEHVEWQGNFRRGLSAELSQELGLIIERKRPLHQINWDISGFWAWKYAGIATRLSAASMLSGDYEYIRDNTSISSYIRGVFDDARQDPSVESSQFIALNVDIPIMIFSTNWFGGIPGKAGILDFEVQLSPFMDLAFSQNTYTGRTMHWKDGWYTAGFEFLIYPLRFRSVVVRASFGFDIGRYWFSQGIDTSWRANTPKNEFYVGIGLFY